jgi:hypothetical protein
MTAMEKITSLIAIMLFIVTSSACSIYKVASQPGPADLKGLGVGSPRTQVIASLGIPKFSDTDPEGRKQDVFEFQSGFNQASKARILPYLAADVFTLGLAELVLWPIEMTVMERAVCTAMASYDPSQKVEVWRVTQKDGFQGC